jgi:predicted GNAT family N-acyltransferase
LNLGDIKKLLMARQYSAYFAGMNSITIKPANTKSELEECFRLREEVFIIEQSVPVDRERDEHDATALHFLALVDAKPVGTARVVLKDNGTAAKIQRVAVRRSNRGMGIGKRLIAAIEEAPVLEGVDHFILLKPTHYSSMPVWDTTLTAKNLWTQAFRISA